MATPGETDKLELVRSDENLHPSQSEVSKEATLEPRDSVNDVMVIDEELQVQKVELPKKRSKPQKSKSPQKRLIQEKTKMEVLNLTGKNWKEVMFIRRKILDNAANKIRGLPPTRYRPVFADRIW